MIEFYKKIFNYEKKIPGLNNLYSIKKPHTGGS
jgi:hypothetical protein